MSSTGLRISEALALEDVDVDLGKRLLVVRNTKFGKTRWVPVHDSTVRALRCYRRERDVRIPTSQGKTYFVAETGHPLSYSAALTAFHHLLCESGLDRQRDRRPRMHDLRHTFLVATVAGWYRRGMEVDARMPALSTYVGHAHLADTYWYLSAAPELMRWTARRVERATSRKEHS
jgi:integrase